MTTNLTQPRKKAKQVNCYCDAYPFTHRMHSGKCEGYKPKVKADAEQWFERDARNSAMTTKDFL